MAAGLPSWHHLVGGLAEELGLEPDGTDGTFSPHALLNVPQFYENHYDRHRLQHKIVDLLGHRPVSQVHRLLAELPNLLYYTTNFDELLEDALRSSDRGHVTIIAEEEDARGAADPRRVQVRKLHGTLSRPRTCVLTRSDYARFRNSSRLMLDALRAHLSEYVFLFVGYSLQDPDFTSIFDDVGLAMGRLRQTHYICLPEVQALERQDLQNRGIQTLALDEWSDDGPTAGLTRFLTELAEQTSELTHVKRFFHGVRAGDHVPVIVSSRTHEVEQFVYIAECDLQVATQIEQALGRLGCSTRRIADRRAVDDHALLSQHDLVLICSPFGNSVTERAFDLLREDEHGPRVKFLIDDGKRTLLSAADSTRLRGDDPVHAIDDERYREYAMVARYRNPWNHDRQIFVLAGLHALGTHAVGRFLSDLRSYERLPVSDGALEVVLTVSYSDHDPYDYRYTIDDVAHLPRLR